jgi:hypothetical protein
MNDSTRGGGRLFLSGTDASPSCLSVCARIQDSGAVRCTIAGSFYIGATVGSRLLLFLFEENPVCLVVLAVTGWCWQEVACGTK